MSSDSSQFSNVSTITLAARDKSVLRGTTAAVLLAGFGSRLRSTAGGIGVASKAEDEFHRSFVVDSLDIFLSHSWHANWALKYFTLLLYFNARAAVVASLLSAAVVCFMRFRPGLAQEVTSVLFTWTRGRPCMVMGSISFFVVLFFWQHFLIHMSCPVRSLFLDKVCIHQTDQSKKSKGIKCISGILGKSDMVLVAWDGTYFSRLWCTFELAAYKKARPNSPVCLLPVIMGGFVAWMIGASFAAEAVAELLMHCHSVTIFATAFRCTNCHVFVLNQLMVAGLGIRQFRIYSRELFNLDQQLRKFSVLDAKCFCCTNNHVLPGSDMTLPCDRELVNASIGKWHGDDDEKVGLKKFDELIRGEFREDIAQSFRGSRVPYVFVLCYSIWIGFYQLDRILWKSYKKDVSNEFLVKKVLIMLHSVFVCHPVNIGLFVVLVFTVFERVEPNFGIHLWWQKVVVNVLMCFVFAGQTLLLVKVGTFLLETYFLGFSLWMGLEVIAVFLLYRHKKIQALERVDGIVTKISSYRDSRSKDAEVVDNIEIEMPARSPAPRFAAEDSLHLRD